MLIEAQARGRAGDDAGQRGLAHRQRVPASWQVLTRRESAAPGRGAWTIPLSVPVQMPAQFLDCALA
jgi:hypothetical protein